MAKQIQSLERGLYILESIVRDSGRITSTEIARRLGVHKSTVSHLTSTLLGLGYLGREPGSNRFISGPRLLTLAREVGLSADALKIAGPLLERMASDTGETAHLAELRGRAVLYLVNRYPASALRVHTETGSLEPAHATAVGKALLSGLSDREVLALYEGHPLERSTDSTIADTRALIEEIARVRSSGIALDREEQTMGTGCIAAPVRGPMGNIVAAVGISGPLARVLADNGALEEKVRGCASRLEESLKTGGLAEEEER